MTIKPNLYLSVAIYFGGITRVLLNASQCNVIGALFSAAGTTCGTNHRVSYCSAWRQVMSERKPFRKFDPQKLAYGHTIHEYTPSPARVQSLERYVNYGIPTGSFLRAALENDFIGAVGNADSDNQRNLFALADFIYNHIPAGCHGSPEKVDGWLASFKRVEG